MSAVYNEQERDSSRGLAEVVLAARDVSPVSGLTHNFYRYPARFSPTFVRAVIQAMSRPGDWVLDPFAGGGTTLVEALAAGRNVIGVDISQLATFVCQAKTLLLMERDTEVVRGWTRQLPQRINMRSPGHPSSDYASAGYYRNVTGKAYWRLKKAIEQALISVTALPNERTQVLARCVVLRTAQWALDTRKVLPTIPRFRQELVRQAHGMLSQALAFRASVLNNTTHPHPEVMCLNCSADDLEREPAIGRIVPPKLVLTSPPYPGIHVLYHRWQVDGRKETPAPFWIANTLDGAGESYYTLGHRKYPQLRTYFEGLRKNFQSITKMCGPETIIVQMVAFAEPVWQLPCYLDVMKVCGLRELRPWKRADCADDGRLWRDVPRQTG